ncbi:MAG: 16S rRNA (guanine(966)-N(2))-methyltransferase RsmD [Clostridia bacterium]|nr:16S rRNA (guanine(966)-N(2))-methyltransferase RsmD [Clostridia bacterium]
MRIITGKARGTKLLSPEGDSTRPTPERVKEAIFSSIQFQLEGTRFLDLFAGSGQMGLEAVSRGASLAVLVDSSAEAVSLIKENAKKTRLFEFCRIVHYQYPDYLRGFRRSGESAFDYIYLDPPFRSNLYADVLERISESGAADPHTLVIVESEASDLSELVPQDSLKRYGIVKTSKYGRISITWLMLRKEEVL